MRSSTNPTQAIQDAPTRYHISWPELRLQLLPSLLRKPRLLAWLSVLTMPVVRLYGIFLAYRVDARRELSYNGQTIMLEKALNDLFDPTRRRIVVRNNDVETLPFFLFYADGGVDEAQDLPYLYYVPECPPGVLPTLTLLPELQPRGFTVYAPGLNRFALPLTARIKQLKVALVPFQILYVTAPPL